MGINQIIIYCVVFFAALGCLDKMIGNKLGLGQAFEEGMMSIGALTMSIVGIIVLVPVIADVCRPVIVPVFELFGADPAMFAGCILANDMGGAPLAQAMATDKDAGDFAGLIVGSMLGGTVVFHIPVSLGIVKKEDKEYVATGILAGVMCVPIGSFAGGLAAGYSLVMIMTNLIPIVLFALLIALGLWKFRGVVIKGFTWFGKLVAAIATFGLGIGLIKSFTGITIVPGTNDISEGFTLAADCAMLLAGSYSLVHVITKLCKKPLFKLGKVLGVNEAAVAGMVSTLAISIPVFHMVKDMDKRGKVVSIAFVVCAASVFGDQLGFTAGFNPDMVFPMIVGKVVGGVMSVAVALWITRMYKE